MYSFTSWGSLAHFPGPSPPARLNDLSRSADLQALSPSGSLRPGLLDLGQDGLVPNQWRDDASVTSADGSVHLPKSLEEPLGKPGIHPMPDKPLQLLKKLVTYLRVSLLSSLTKICIQSSYKPGMRNRLDFIAEQV